MFYEIMGSETRNPEQIISKWHDLTLKCPEFGDIYNNVNNLHQSGSSDFNAFRAALNKNGKTHDKLFSISQTMANIERCSKIGRANRKNFTKLFQFKAFKKPRRNFPTIGWENTFDINDDPIDLENEQSLRRLVGRNKAKKKKVGLSTFEIQRYRSFRRQI